MPWRDGATLPAALSILTTSFHDPSDRHTALGVWGGVGGLASAVGVLLGGLLTEGPGWRRHPAGDRRRLADPAGGIFWLSRIPVDGSYVADLLPGLIVMSIGFGPVFVGVTTAANAGVPADKAGLAASPVNASQQLGGALGLAIFSALAAARTKDLLAGHAPPSEALTAGFGRALLASSIFLLAAAVIALRATDTRGEAGEGEQPSGPDVPSVLAYESAR